MYVTNFLVNHTFPLLGSLDPLSPTVSPSTLFSSNHGITGSLYKKMSDPFSQKDIYCISDSRMQKFLEGSFKANTPRKIGITLILNELSDGKTCTENNFADAAFCDEKTNPTCQNGSFDFQPMLNLSEMEEKSGSWTIWFIIAGVLLVIGGGGYGYYYYKVSKEDWLL